MAGPFEFLAAVAPGGHEGDAGLAGRQVGFHADFLLRVDAPDRPSRWGDYHYEVAVTKLARHVKAGAVLQICTYVEMLTAVQGIDPVEFHVVLGGSTGGLRTFLFSLRPVFNGKGEVVGLVPEALEIPDAAEKLAA